MHLESSDSMIYLMGCAIREQIPDIKIVENMNLNGVFGLSCRHKTSAMAAMALEPLVMMGDSLIEKTVWTKWVQSRDNILYDENFQKTVCHYMVSQGYEARSVGLGNHDSYLREPVFNYEFHTKLFSESLQDGIWSAYFENVIDRALKDSDNNYGYHLSADDLYVYTAAHAFKHYDNSGTGVRTIADNYLIRRVLGGQLHWDLINKELKKLGILGFDCTLRSLGEHLFADPAASE